MIRLVLILFVLVFGSFKPLKGVELIFKNDSEEDFIEFKVSVENIEYNFTSLKKGERTKAIRVKETYWFYATTAITDKDTVVFTDFCPVGETMIKDGSLVVSYAIYPKRGQHRRLVANEVLYSGSAKNVGFTKLKLEE
jgi:hypothetical protein